MIKNKKIPFCMDDILEVILIILFIVIVVKIKGWEPSIYKFFNVSLGNVIAFDVQRLTFQFLWVATLASICSLVFGVAIGLLCQTELGKDFRIIIEAWASIIRAVPQVAMLRFIIPLIGLGVWPTVIALTTHGILPIILGIISGIDNIPKEYDKVAKAMGMTKWQSMFKVKVPLALPVIIAGLRVAIISCIGGATLGASTGAEGLGLLLTAGQETYNTVLIFECALIIGLLSIIVDKFFRRLETLVQIY